MNKAKKAAGIEDYRFHDHRHTVGSRSTRSTGNLNFTKRLLGHASIATTQKYAHVLDDDVREAMDGASFDTESPQNPRDVTRKKPRKAAK